MGLVKKILKIFIQIMTWVLLVLLLFAVYGKIQVSLLGKDYSTLLGYSMFQVASGSMEPTLNVDDVILVKVNSDFKVNDIISYMHDDAIITHRVLSISGNKITVKGDANNTIDVPIDKEIVIGKVVKVFKELKIWQKTLTEPKILVCLVITLLLFDFAFSYKKKDTNIKEEKTQKKDKKVIKLKKKIKPKKEIVKKVKTNNEELLSLTKKIDLNEIKEILKKEQQETNTNDNDQEAKKTGFDNIVEFPLYNQEDAMIGYTVRLDLKAIQDNISKKIK